MSLFLRAKSNSIGQQMHYENNIGFYRFYDTTMLQF